MRRNRPAWQLPGIACACLAGALVVWCGSNHARAAGAARAEEARLQQAIQGVARWRQLSAMDATASDHGRAPTDLGAIVDEQLRALGARRVSQTSVSLGSESSVGESGLMRVDAGFSLEPITPNELAGFIERWVLDRPLWVITSVKLQHVSATARGRGRPQPGGAGSFRAVIRLENLFVPKTPDAMALRPIGEEPSKP